MIVLHPKVKELVALRNRARRQFGLGNITRDLYDRIDNQLNVLADLFQEANDAHDPVTDEGETNNES